MLCEKDSPLFFASCSSVVGVRTEFQSLANGSDVAARVTTLTKRQNEDGNERMGTWQRLPVALFSLVILGGFFFFFL